MIKSTFFSFLILFLILIIAGCSSTKSTPVIPENPQADINLPANELNTSESLHSILGAWTLSINHETLEATVTPNRSLERHYNVKYLIPIPEVSINTIYPNYVIDADVTLTNPYIFHAYDLRLIIFTDEYDHFLNNADAWTDLYDIPDGQDINPFKAYAKDQPNRIFEGESQHTENLLVFNPPPGHPIQFAIDASFPNNCEEPYEISGFTQDDLFDQAGAVANVEITVKSWADNPCDVYLYCPIICGAGLLEFNHIADDIYGANLVNNTGAYSGTYEGFIVAYSYKHAQIALYNDVMISIEPSKNGWARTWGSTGSEEGSKDVVVDDFGNIYVCGWFENTIDLDPGPGEDIHFSLGQWDTYVSKFNSDGGFIWGRTWGSPGEYDTPRGVILDNDGGVYICGGFHYTVDFDPGPGEALFTAENNSNRDAYLNKLDTDGNYVWTKTWGGIGGWDVAYDVQFDGIDKLYVIGLFNETVDFDPNSGYDSRSAEGEYDSYLCQLDIHGNYYWVQAWGGSHMTVATSLAYDGNASLYITGWFDGNVDFDPSNGVDQHESSGSWDAYLSKFNTSGDFEWVGVWGDPEPQHGVRVDTDSFGSVYVAGHFFGTVDFDHGAGIDVRTSNGNFDSYVSKLTPFGEQVWTLAWGAEENDCCYGIGLDESDNLYVTGSFRSTVDLDPGPGMEEITSNGNADIFLTRFTPEGDFIWSRAWGGAGHDMGYELITDCNGNIFVNGNYSDVVDFDPGPNTEEHTSNGQHDAYIIKLLPNGYWE